MEESIAANARGGRLAAAIEFARRAPSKVLAAVLGAHLVVWTLLPILVCPNLQLDLVEDLALGKEWQLGYWKHPPLPWWAADLLYRLTGQIDSIYLLGPLAAVLCCYGVWLLARELTDPLRALIAVLVLEGVHFYNFSAVKFAHDQAQLPFWSFTGLFFYRALARGRMLDWMLAGAFLAGAFWAKYAAFALAATLGLFLLIDPAARRAWRTSGPYVMAFVFAAAIAPNAWWLVNHDFMPFQYVDARAKAADHWYQFIAYPLQWTGSQFLFLLPAIGLLALLYGNWRRGTSPSVGAHAAFDRRYVTALALGPFAVTTLVAAVLGRLPVAMWGYPLWSFAPLAALMWMGPVADSRRLQPFARGFVAVFIAFPLLYAAVELFEPFVRDRPKATQFPGTLVADTLTRQWHERFGSPLRYVGGAEFVANTVAVYSADRPHVIVRGDPALAPWIDMKDVSRHGTVLVWENGLPGVDLDRWRARFGEFDVQGTLRIARRTWHPVQPVSVSYGFVAPRPESQAD
jgi:4-amino-4-deoxy-L-arabinose transferase-like glycosyltransferase